jgi:hypothetical protein
VCVASTTATCQDGKLIPHRVERAAQEVSRNPHRPDHKVHARGPFLRWRDRRLLQCTTNVQARLRREAYDIGINAQHGATAS